jgi:Predicted membrane protein
MLLPWVWSWFNQLSLSQMSVTVAVIMAVPVAPGDPLESGRRVASQSLQRVMGCFIGGIAGLLLLALSLTEFLPWLLALTAVLWVGAYIQTSTRRGYIGTQAVLVLIMTLVQGWGRRTASCPASRASRHDRSTRNIDGRLADFLAPSAQARAPDSCGKLTVTEP